jgi:hypothetical protein
MTTNTKETLNVDGLVPANKKGAAPHKSETSNNLEKPVDGQKLSLSIDVDAERLRAFKIYAAMHGIKLYTLFETVWDYYEQQHG